MLLLVKFWSVLVGLIYRRMHIGGGCGGANAPSKNGDHVGAPKKRGRRRMFTAEQLAEAHRMKSTGKCNNEIAKILYKTSNPTADQRRSVPTTLKYHFGGKGGSSMGRRE